MSKKRISLEDSKMTMIVKLSESNPGACTVILETIEKGSRIDPDSAFGQISSMIMLDEYGIYGSRIWMLYKDVCNKNITSLSAILRAVQLGKLSEDVLNHAIDNNGDSIDINNIVDIVKKELPKFGRI